ncbi:anaphase-promoting complex subunit 6 [Dorcoceras hygrometricum]|uniref:Anaphase-promoting complex subunit 6 n=1 Tax=Dorcoceras hygrometricum TaxID=472368 RepID=A0A2Z7ALH0_9LAMI|nr:anaphase-promoting complex subunit 6 [Dorcoceras hygrometricum]
MSSSTESLVRSVVNAIDSNPKRPEVKGPWLPEQAELGSRNAPWYEEKSSNLRSSDISFIKEKGGMFDNFEDNMYTLTPRTPDRSLNLASFLDAMRGKSYNAPELIQEDLLCFFGFSRRGVELVGDLDERMDKTEMLKLMEEEEGRAPTPSKHKTEDRPRSPPIITIAEASSPKKKGPGRVPPLDYFEDSLVASPSRVVATRGCESLRGPTYFGMLLISPGFSFPLVLILTIAPCACNGLGGEVVRRLTRAHRAVTATRRSFDEAMGQHAELVERLEELEALRAQEQRAAEAQEEALEAQLAVEKAAQEATKSELDVTLAKKAAIEIELEETKAHAEEEVERLKSEAIHVWDLSKEEFLQSSEFDTLCTKKALRYFKDGFAGCLTQFRANGYSEEDHPASFLDTKKALMEMPTKIPRRKRRNRATSMLLPRAPPPQ